MRGEGSLYKGYPREFWIGAYVGGITFLCQHAIFSFLMFSLTLWSIAIFYAIPMIMTITLICFARQGIKSTAPVGTEPKGSWGVPRLFFCGILVYQSFLWGVQSIFKQAVDLTPCCTFAPNGLQVNPDTNEVEPIEYDHDLMYPGYENAEWFPRNNYQSFYEQSCAWSDNKNKFYAHALTGPIVLMLGCFNFMRFSRGSVFPLWAHKWAGRVHNVVLLAAAGAGASLSSITAAPFWIALGFYLLVLFWVPTMILGWWFIRQGNIEQHSRWMTRNFSFTAGAITLRLYNLVALGNTPYWVMVWLTIITTYPIAEGYLQYQSDCDRLCLRSLVTPNETTKPVPEDYKSNKRTKQDDRNVVETLEVDFASVY